MKTLTRLFVVFCACNALALTALAGPERINESKEVVPVPQPDCCQWQGFYLGVHVGGQFGDSDSTFNFENIPSLTTSWGYDESGIVGGAQAGYNFQWGHFVLGPEFDIGYMNLDGKGTSPASAPVIAFYELAETSSDFYGTFRLRLGYANDCWLFYVTGGGIGVNYEADYRFIPSPTVLSGHEEDWAWGYTVGGGIERKIGCHWSIKLEYLYFNLEEQSFAREISTGGTGTSQFLPGGTSGTSGSPDALDHFKTDTDGHMVRAGLNYHF